MEIAYLAKTKQNALCLGWINGKHIYWQNQNKIFYVYDGSMEIECISKNKAKCFISMMDQRKMCTVVKLMQNILCI